MPELIRVRVKSTGALIWIAPVELNDSVEIVDQPKRVRGNALPKPRVNVVPPAAPAPVTPPVEVEDDPEDLSLALPDVALAEDDEPEKQSAGTSSGPRAGKSGTNRRVK